MCNKALCRCLLVIYPPFRKSNRIIKETPSNKKTHTHSFLIFDYISFDSEMDIIIFPLFDSANIAFSYSFRCRWRPKISLYLLHFHSHHFAVAHHFVIGNDCVRGRADTKCLIDKCPMSRKTRPECKRTRKCDAINVKQQLQPQHQMTPPKNNEITAIQIRYSLQHFNHIMGIIFAPTV